MTATLTWAKEITYNFTYGTDSTQLEFYVNGIDGKRYQGNPSISTLTPINMSSTGLTYQTINATLEAERTWTDSESNVWHELLYYLSDVDKYVFTYFVEGSGFGGFTI